MKDWTYWCQDSEKVHHISRAELDTAKLPLYIAKELNKLLEGEIVYCDSIQWDSFWLDTLFSAAAISRKFTLLDLKDLLIRASEDSVNRFEYTKSIEEQSGIYRRHRALDDATVLFNALKSSIHIE